MKTVPILACDSVASNLFEEWQTQHRVPMKPQPIVDTVDAGPIELSRFQWAKGKRRFLTISSDETDCRAMLAGVAPWQPGDRLYVRECWGLWDTQPSDGPEGATLLYRATEGRLHENRYQLWRPSILMPKWAARTWLEVSRVWAERVQEISEADAQAEGVDRHFHREEAPNLFTLPRSTYRRGFAALWETLYPGSWERNEWVWSCEFRKIEAPQLRSEATAAAT